MVVLEAKVEAVAADKKAKYSNKIKKTKELVAGKKRKSDEDIIVTAPPTAEGKVKKPKRERSILKDTSVGGQETPSRKKSLKFDEKVKVKTIEGKPVKSKKKKEQLDGKIKEKKFKKKIDTREEDGEKKPFVKLDKKETREKQKKEKSERKAKKIELDVYNLGVEAKRIWEELRDEDKMKNMDQKKLKLTGELHSLVKGNIKKIIFAHDTVRVVECLMAMGSDEVKEAIFQEMKEDVIEMAKSKYAVFFVQKLLRYGSKEQKQHVMKAMSGRVAR
jgi:pumilio family protein 6